MKLNPWSLATGLTAIAGAFSLTSAVLSAQAIPDSARQANASAQWNGFARQVITGVLQIQPGEKVLIMGPASSAPILEALMVAVAESGGDAEATISSNRVTQVVLRAFADSQFLARESPDAVDRARFATYRTLIVLEGRDADYRGFLGSLTEHRRVLFTDSASARWTGLERQGRVLALSLPGYGDALAARRPYERMLQEEAAAILASSADVQRNGERLAAALRSAHQIVITNPDGSRFSAGLLPREPVIEGAHLPRPSGGAKLATMVLPAGRLAVFVDPRTAEGHVAVSEDECVIPVHGVKLSVTHGVPGLVWAAADTACMRGAIARTKQASYVTIGLNPVVDPHDGSAVPASRLAGVVSIGFGSDADVGGTNGIEGWWLMSMANATVVADGSTIVRDGKLVSAR